MTYSEKAMQQIQNLRKERKITQQQLADVLGITYQAYAHYEKNRCKPDIDTLVTLADYFGVTISYLIGRE